MGKIISANFSKYPEVIDMTETNNTFIFIFLTWERPQSKEGDAQGISDHHLLGSCRAVKLRGKSEGSTWVANVLFLSSKED